ncbi:MAG: hypothetical protein ACOYMA_15740 [Bacteroidia bacterium]|jgi:hypothetical protein
MKLKTIIILTIIISNLFSCKDSGESVFTDKTYQDTIKQNIGGLLIREIHYYDDFSSWIYDVKYSYKDKFDSISSIGSGSFYKVEPPKDEQLIQIAKWTIFKTSSDRDKDLLFICDNDTKKWTEFEISPKTIEQTGLWREQNIDSELENWDTVSKIDKIDQDGNITVNYTYAKKNRIFSFITGERQISYKINLQTGRPEMTGVAEI